jgi:cobalamin biosynthesis protein CbiG
MGGGEAMVRRLAIGVGCTSTAAAEEVTALVATTLALCPGQVAVLATAAKRADHPAILAAAAHFGVPVQGFADLGDGVAEPAARRFGPLLVAKRKSAHATCAIAELAP